MKILSIDGGGIRGVIPCVILKAIENQAKSNVCELFDLVAGTSTGGLIALGLTKPGSGGYLPEPEFDANEMLQFYKEHGNKIFEKRGNKGWLFSILGLLNSDLGEVGQKPYDVSFLEEILLEKFGDSELKESLTNLLVTSHDLKTGEPFYFISRLASDDANENFLFRDMARATSAAPTYFPPKNISRDGLPDLELIDGGVFANNPSALAYAEAKELWYGKGMGEKAHAAATRVSANTVAPKDEDLPIFLLSVGTGYHKKEIEPKGLKITKDWIKPLTQEIFIESASENTHYLMKHLLPEFSNGNPRYVRLNVELPIEHLEMDDASEKNISKLEEIASQYVRENMGEIEKVVELLK